MKIVKMKVCQNILLVLGYKVIPVNPTTTEVTVTSWVLVVVVMGLQVHQKIVFHFDQELGRYQR
jgi:predicted CoA-binding protein